MFTKSDSVVDKLLSCPRIKLSNSHSLILDSMETWVLLSDFGQQLCRKKADVSSKYFTLLGAARTNPSLVLIQTSKTKEGVNASRSTSEHQKLRKLYTLGGGDGYRFARVLMKTGDLPVSKVRQFSHSEISYTKFTLVTRKNKRMNGFAALKKKEICFDGSCFCWWSVKRLN